MSLKYRMKSKIFSILFTAVLLGCTYKSNTIDASKFILDFESKSYLDSISISHNGILTKDIFYKGNASFSLFKNCNLKLNPDFKPKKIYKISCWKKGEIKITTLLENSKQKISVKENLSYKHANGWDKVELLVNTSWFDTIEKAIVCVENMQNKKAWIDDLIIEEIYGENPEFSFQIKKEAVKKIIKLRNKATHSSYIKSKYKKKIKSKLNGNSVTIKLKGDWTDHILSSIWSFKTYGSSPIIQDLKTLTFQNVKTRNLLKEWTFIKLCKEAGIVSPKYDIVSVAINGGTPYVCALEEAFSNDFIFRKRGYSAPVLRLYEDFLFPHWVYGWKHKEVKIPEINHSYIYCFEGRKYSKGSFKTKFYQDALKLKEFIKANSIIHLIDKEKWAEFLAIQALTKSYHNLTWHNTRWFVNDKGLLEPIAYDGNTQNGEAENWFGGLYGDLNRYLNNGPSVAINFTNKLFMNSEFMNIYIEKLSQYSNESFLKERLQNFSNEIEISLIKIQKYYDYDYNTDYLFKSAKQIREHLKKIDNSTWIGKEHIFNLDFKTGNAPLNKVYAENLIRGYYNKGNLMFINGTSEQIKIYNIKNIKEHYIPANGELKIKYINGAKWFIDIENDEIEIPIVSWMPLN